MRRGQLSKADKVAAHDAIVEHRDSLAQYAWHIVNGHAPDVIETVHYDGDTYTYSLYGVMRANGGLLVSTFTSEGQSTSIIDTCPFDDWYRRLDKLPYGHNFTETKIAADKLFIARSRIVAAHAANDVLPGEEA